MREPDDIITYKGKEYPVVHVNVTIDEHDDGWIHTYPIAPESLLDTMIENSVDYDEEGFDGEEADIDNQIYHYVEDQYWDLPLEVICKEHLDLPMTIVPDEDIDYCLKYPDSEALPDEDGKCSLCGGDCVI